MIPIIIPTPTGGGKPPTCPGCGEPEDKKTTCRHCGHEYKRGPSAGSFLIALSAVAIMLVMGMWIGWTMLQWLIPSEGNPSLEEVLSGQWEWIQSKTLTEDQKTAREWKAYVEERVAYALLIPQYEPPDPRDPRDPWGTMCGSVSCSIVTSAGSSMPLNIFPERIDQ